MKSFPQARQGEPGAPVLDLLRERRRTLNQQPYSSILVQRRSLLTRGGLIGASLVGATALISALVLLQRGLVQMELGELRQYEQKAQLLRAELQQRQQRLRAITKTNRDLAGALTSGRTSSALLMALQLGTPAGVQLLAAESNGPNLVLKGRAFDPMALVRINALQLELDRSPLMEAKGMKLTKVERQPAQPVQTPAAAAPGAKVVVPPPPPPPPLAFEMGGPFATLTPPQQLETLRKYGSEGMVRRLQLLRAEGLLP